MMEIVPVEISGDFQDYVNVNECGYIMQDQCHPKF